MDLPPELLQWLLIAIAIILGTRLWWKHRGLPPGPMGLPFFGYNPFLSYDAPHKQLAELAKHYGDIFSLRLLGGGLLVVVNGPKASKEVFHDRAEEFYGRYQPTNVLNYFDGSLGIAQTEGSDWKEKRRFFLSAAKNFGFGKTEFEGYIQDLIGKMMDDIRAEKNRQIDIKKKVTLATGNVISKIVCDKKYKEDDPQFLNLLDGFSGIISGGLKEFFLVGIFFRLWLKFSFAGRSKMRLIEKLHSIIRGIIQEHVETFDPNHQRDFIDAYLSQMKTLTQKGQLHNSSFSMDSLHSITLNMLLEGTESTGSTIASLLLKLSEYPEIQNRAQKEIDDVVGHSRLPSWTDRPKLPYIDALVLELYRVAVFFNLSTFYSNFEEAELRGFRIPKRSILMINFWSINNDPKLFPNPEKFRPERFLGPDGKRTKQENPVPFGVGKRSCVGESLAQVEVFLFIACLLQNFTLYPGEDFKIRFEPRSSK